MSDGSGRKPDLLSDLCEGLISPPDQGFHPLDPALDDVALWTHADRLLEGTAEVIGAETRHAGQAVGLI